MCKTLFSEFLFHKPSISFCIHISWSLIFLYPETNSSKTILLTFLLIKHNSIPHTFFMKTQILLCYCILKYFSNYF